MNMPLTPAIFNGHHITMSSREIADVCETRHNQVVETIQRLFASGVLRESRNTTRRVQPEGGGRPTDVYDLTKRDTLIVVSGYKDELRARIIDRWLELEGQGTHSALPDFSDPQVILGVITNLQGEVAKKDAQLIAQQPKVEAFDHLMNTDGLYGLQNAGRALGARPNLFTRWLKQDYLFYQGTALVPRIQYIQRGYFEVKTTIVEDKARPTTFVTAKGLEHLRNRVPQDVMIGGAA